MAHLECAEAGASAAKRTVVSERDNLAEGLGHSDHRGARRAVFTGCRKAMSSTTNSASIVAAIIVLVVPSALAGLKGRWGLLWIGMLLGFIGGLGRLAVQGETGSGGFASWLGTEAPLWVPWVVGASRLARPTSIWYRRWYSAEKRGRAVARFTGAADGADAQVGATGAQRSRKRRTLIIVGRLLFVLLLVSAVGVLVSALVSPSSRSGKYSAEDRSSFLSGCEQGHRGSPAFCHCVLAKTEAHITHGEFESLHEAYVRHGISALASFRRLALECAAPKGAYAPVVQSQLIARCEEGRASEASLCHCIIVKIEASYSLAELEALEASHDARLEASIKRFAGTCANQAASNTSSSG
jgi:hypothetical protein